MLRYHGWVFMQKQPRYVSLRWQIAVPAALILAAVMTSAYFLGQTWGPGTVVSQANILFENGRSMMQRANLLYEDQLVQAQMAAANRDISAALAENESAGLARLLETQVARLGLDAMILVDAQSTPVAVFPPDVASLLDSGESIGAAQSTEPQPLLVGRTLFVSAPVFHDETQVGSVWAGLRIERVLSTLRGRARIHLALYAPDAVLLQTSFPATPASLQRLAVSADDVDQSAQNADALASASLQIGAEAYHAVYFPIEYGALRLGTLAVLLPEQNPATVELGRQLGGLTISVAAGLGVIGVFVMLAMMTARINRITRTAEALAAGNPTARTGMRATDEIGALGQALDQFADYTRERQDYLRDELRRRRREAAFLQSVLESMPDGVVLQDLSGSVILINERARQLLGSAVVSDDADLQQAMAHTANTLGPALAPGLYSLGSPLQIDREGRVLSAQAAAVMTGSSQRIGTIVVIRDVTDDIRREQAREQLLLKVASEIYEPVAALAQSPSMASMREVSREIARHAAALQRLVLEMRELADPGLIQLTAQGQRPIRLETLVWSIANEWRQVAQANNLAMHVIIERPGLFVLGDERRLRWAIGNIVDNAIKYTPPSGALTLEIRDDLSDGRAHLRVRDNGVGIAADDLPHIFTRFYRGTPSTREGRLIQVPGTGQGLATARQIFEAHGGGIDLKSKAGVGTAVYFTIPLTAPVGMDLPGLVDLEGETVRINTAVINSAS